MVCKYRTCACACVFVDDSPSASPRENTTNCCSFATFSCHDSISEISRKVFFSRGVRAMFEICRDPTRANLKILNAIARRSRTGKPYTISQISNFVAKDQQFVV